MEETSSSEDNVAPGTVYDQGPLFTDEKEDDYDDNYEADNEDE